MRSASFGKRTRRGSGPVVVELEGRVVPSFFAPRDFNVGAYPWRAAAGDFNGDSRPDLAVTAVAGINILLGNGEGTFLTQALGYLVGSEPQSVTARDFDGDGFPDLAAANQGSNDGSVLLNDGIWTSPGPRPLPGGRAPDRFVCDDLGGRPTAAVPERREPTPLADLPPDMAAPVDHPPTPAAWVVSPRAGAAAPPRLLDQLFANGEGLAEPGI